MRFVQYYSGNGETKVGVLSADQKRVSELKGFPSMVKFLESNPCVKDLQGKLSGLSSVDVSSVKLMSPITSPDKIVCVGLNYVGFCQQQNIQPPSQAMFFSKFNSSITGPFDPIIAHEISNEIDWEVELVVVIGKGGKKIKKENAFDHIFGYCIAQDITARDWQKKNNGQLLIAKTMDTFCPLGPSLVHKNEVPDPHKLDIKCSVNGKVKQTGNTEELVFRIDELIHLLSQSITLKPGDIMLTGTPKGVGMAQSPPEYLKPGDVVESEVEILGKMANRVIKDE